MLRFRVFSAVLVLASGLTLAACSGDDDKQAAPATPSAGASAGSSAADAAAPGSDRELCKAMQQVADNLKDELYKISESGDEPTPVVLQGVLTKLQQQVTAAAFNAGDTAAALAARRLGAEAGTAATNADPVATLNASAFAAAESDLVTACKTAGVTVSF